MEKFQERSFDDPSSIFFFLTQKYKKTLTPCQKVRIPPTLLIQNSFPREIFFYDPSLLEIHHIFGKECSVDVVRRKFGVADELIEKLRENGQKKSRIFCKFIYFQQRGEKKLLKVEYWTKDDFNLRETGILQRYLPPGVRNNSVIKVVWTPYVTTIERRENINDAEDSDITPYNRLEIWNAPVFFSRCVFVSQKLKTNLEIISQRITRHYTMLLEGYTVDRMELFFKLAGKRVYFLFSTDICIRKGLGKTKINVRRRNNFTLMNRGTDVKNPARKNQWKMNRMKKCPNCRKPVEETYLLSLKDVVAMCTEEQEIEKEKNNVSLLEEEITPFTPKLKLVSSVRVEKNIRAIDDLIELVAREVEISCDLSRAKIFFDEELLDRVKKATTTLEFGGGGRGRGIKKEESLDLLMKHLKIEEDDDVQRFNLIMEKNQGHSTCQSGKYYLPNIDIRVKLFVDDLQRIKRRLIRYQNPDSIESFKIDGKYEDEIGSYFSQRKSRKKKSKEGDSSDRVPTLFRRVMKNVRNQLSIPSETFFQRGNLRKTIKDEQRSRTLKLTNALFDRLKRNAIFLSQKVPFCLKCFLHIGSYSTIDPCMLQKTRVGKKKFDFSDRRPLSARHLSKIKNNGNGVGNFNLRKVEVERTIFSARKRNDKKFRKTLQHSHSMNVGQLRQHAIERKKKLLLISKKRKKKLKKNTKRVVVRRRKRNTFENLFRLEKIWSQKYFSANAKRKHSLLKNM